MNYRYMLTTWTNLGNIILSKRSQFVKTYTIWFHLYEYALSFWGDGNVLKLITVMDAQLFVNQLQSTELYTFKWVNGIKNYVSILNKAVF